MKKNIKIRKSSSINGIVNRVELLYQNEGDDLMHNNKKNIKKIRSNNSEARSVYVNDNDASIYNKDNKDNNDNTWYKCIYGTVISYKYVNVYIYMLKSHDL